MDARYYLGKLVDVFIGIAVVILSLRVLFRLVDANPGAAFVDWIYATSGALMAPFRGIFPSEELGRGIVLDVSAIFAIIMYLIIGFLLLALVDMVPRDDRVDDTADDRPVATRRGRAAKR